MGEQKSSVRASARLRRPSWKDPKLLVGITLILLSVIAVVGIVRLNDHTEPFYTAKRDIAVGEELSEEDFQVTRMQLGEAGGKYWSPSQELADSAVATAPIAAGELVARTAVGQTDQLNRKPVTVSVPAETAVGLQNGRPVDLWVAAKSPQGTGYEDPQLKVSAAEVSRITREQNALGAADEAAVQLLVLEEELPELIKAVSSDARITVIPSFQEG